MIYFNILFIKLKDALIPRSRFNVLDRTFAYHYNFFVMAIQAIAPMITMKMVGYALHVNKDFLFMI
jgi:hypothetical protein